MARYFQSGLCGCCDDCGICCITCLCPAMQMATNRASVEDRECNMCDFLVLCHSFPEEYHTRQMIRRKFNMEDSKCNDCYSLYQCWACVVCQDGREIKIRMNALFNGAPPVAATPPPPTTDYENTLFGCFDDINGCLLGTFCPHCLAICNRAGIEEREAACCDYVCCAGEYYNRRMIRQKYNFPRDNECEDCLVSCVCMPCSACQNDRELKLRRARNDPITPLFLTYAAAPPTQIMVAQPVYTAQPPQYQ